MLTVLVLAAGQLRATGAKNATAFSALERGNNIFTFVARVSMLSEKSLKFRARLFAQIHAAQEKDKNGNSGKGEPASNGGDEAKKDARRAEGVNDAALNVARLKIPVGAVGIDGSVGIAFGASLVQTPSALGHFDAFITS